MEFKPASYKEIGEALMKNGVREMYHALVNEADIVTLFTIPNLSIFWCCRCHLVADDGSTAHEHLHALVQYDGATHNAFKQRLKRAGTRLHAKTTFKKIICPDHMVGTLRYITCRDGQRVTKRDADGLMGAPHTHYSRSVFESYLLHKRNGKQLLGCGDIRLGILQSVKRQLKEEWVMENVSGHPHYLHHHETCLCDNGEIGKKKKKEANEKRREFYKSERGQEVRKAYKEKNDKKREMIKILSALKVNKKAELTKETIETLMNLI